MLQQNPSNYWRTLFYRRYSLTDRIRKPQPDIDWRARVLTRCEIEHGSYRDLNTGQYLSDRQVLVVPLLGLYVGLC